MKRIAVVLAAFALLLSACSGQEPERSADDYTLYYTAPLSESGGGDAIRSGVVRIEDSASLTTEELAAKLIDELLRPEGETARSPFPAGTSLQQLEVAQGRARLDLSGQYARLSGIDLSLADACVTLTLTQLSGIYAVSITANGRELPYRQTQLLTAADALLSSNEDVLRPIDVTLWFLDVRTGQLRELQQTIGLFEGQSRVSAVLDALKAGPDGDEMLQKLLPEDFAILSARTEDGICSVNLSSQSAQLVDETLRGIAMESLSRSILSLSGVEEVRYLVDGESAPQWTLRADAQSAE